jgi:toxin ParE1/3/4
LQNAGAHEVRIFDARKCRSQKYRRAKPQAFGEAVAVALETYIRATIARIAVVPNGAQPLPQRPGVRVVPLIRYPFKIFYSVIEATVMILHIRHAARRPWRVE